MLGETNAGRRGSLQWREGRGCGRPRLYATENTPGDSNDKVETPKWGIGLDSVREKIDTAKLERLAKEVASLTVLESVAFTKTLCSFLGVPYEQLTNVGMVQQVQVIQTYQWTQFCWALHFFLLLYLMWLCKFERFLYFF